MLVKKSICLTVSFFEKMIFVFILLGFSTLKAQQIHPISLKEALKIAKENNISIRKSQLEIQLSEENIKENKELRLPVRKLAYRKTTKLKLGLFTESSLKTNNPAVIKEIISGKTNCEDSNQYFFSAYTKK